MKRFWLVPLLALAGLAASPSNASAHFLFRWCQPYDGGFGHGRWGTPYYYAVPQYYVVPQFYIVPLAPPIVVPPNPVPKAKATGIPRSDAPPRSAPMVTVTPGIVEPDPMVKPANLATPMPAPAPMNPLTIPDPMVPKSPTTGLPPIVVPDIAKPMAAPADNLPGIPLPEPRKATKNDKDDLPPLVLPPEGTGTSSGVIPTTSKSSPLSGAIKTQVFAAAGTATGTLRKVGFFNHTGRDLDLVIEGKAVKLPKKSYLNAELPVKFTWKADGNEAHATTVPDGAAGVDVLFKE